MFNPRQERERNNIKTKSQKCLDAVRVRYGRIDSVATDGLRNGYVRSDSVATDDALPVATEPLRKPYVRIDSVAIRASESDSESDSSEKIKEAPLSFAVHDLAERLYARHPKKEFKILAEQALAGVLADLPDPLLLARKIDASHEAWCAHWGLRPAYTPKLANWLNAGGFMDDPPPVESAWAAV